jgi:hypothetical protein
VNRLLLRFGCAVLWVALLVAQDVMQGCMPVDEHEELPTWKQQSAADSDTPISCRSADRAMVMGWRVHAVIHVPELHRTGC